MIGLALALVHFCVPLAYYFYMRFSWLGKPWNIKRVSGYKPSICVVIPTFNEADFIWRKLDDVYRQNYPRDKLRIVVVDSASNDGTDEIVEKWIGMHRDVNALLIREPVRRGKSIALNNALKHVSEEVVVITDADSLWLSENTLARVAEFFADSIVAAVSCLKKCSGLGVSSIEESYREFYNIIRLAESKAWSTPIFHGELAAFRRSFLERIGGFPTDIGADDSYTAAIAALTGFRAITPEDVLCMEFAPRKGYAMWRIRRAQHLTQSFAKILKHIGKHNAPKQFKAILLTEAYLHLANPWLLPTAATLLVCSAIMGEALATIILVLGALLLLYKPFRTWVSMQIFLVAAMIRNLWAKEIVWSKQRKQ